MKRRREGSPWRSRPSGSGRRAVRRRQSFLLPNPWDRGSAWALYRLGFRALATTSAGAAFSRGLPDAVGAMPCDDVIAHVREIVDATPLPVNADFQDGYADDPDGVAAHVTRCVATGAAGLSIEDATGDPAAPLYPRDAAIARVRAARRAIDTSGTGVVLTARCEAWLVGDPDPERTAIDRLVAFADAGADCLYAPGVCDPDVIATLVRAVAPRPVNVLVSTPVPGLDLARLADLGVAFLRAARGLAETGSFDGLAGAAPFAELDSLFRDRR